MIVLVPPTRRAVTRAMAQGAPAQWLYLGLSFRTAEAVAGWLGTDARRLGLAGVLQDEAKALRQAYVDYIGRLRAERDSDAWWYGSLSEKNPAISRAFLHVCYSSLAVKICDRLGETDRLLIVAESSGVRRAIAGHLRERGVRFLDIGESAVSRALTAIRDGAERAARKAWNIGTYAYRMVVAKALGFSAQIGNAAPGSAWTLLHNWVDARAFDADGRYRDVFFGSLREDLARRGVPVAVVATVLPRAPYLRLLRQLKRAGVPVLVPYAALTFRTLLSHSFSMSAAGPERRTWPRFHDLDLSGILDEVERMDRIHTRVADVFLLDAFIARWRAHHDVEAFIYTFEGHTWERGYCRAMRGQFQKVRLIGYQHSTVSPLSLNYCVSQAEWGRVPFPDRIVTSGPRHYELLRRGGIPEHVLACGGALRYTNLGSGAPAHVSPGPAGRIARILVPFSIIPEHAAELLAAVCAAFGDPREFGVTLKFHPSMQASRVAAAAGIALDSLPAHMRIVDEPVSRLLQDADLLVYTDTTVAFEALAHGLPVVHLQSNHDIDLDPLESFEGARVSVETPEALLAAARAALQAGDQERATRARLGREVVGLLLSPPDEKTIDLFMPGNVR